MSLSRPFSRARARLARAQLDHNKLEALPDFSRLAKLAALSAADNEIAALPRLGLPPSVTSLSLARNALGEVPASLLTPAMAKLQVLDLSGNRLAAVPPGIGALAGALELLLDANAIEALPPEIAALKKLRVLSLRHNRVGGEKVADFQALPAALFTETSVSTLNLEGNPITKPQLLDLDGFSDFLERRKKARHKDEGGALADHGVCGLD